MSVYVSGSSLLTNGTITCQSTVIASSLTLTDSLGTNIFINGGNKSLSGTSNIGIGNNCLKLLTSGTSNIGIGNNCLSVLTTGFGNVCLGDTVGSSITNGNNNCLFGNNVATSLTQGSQNIVIGDRAGGYLTTGSNNVLIGRDTNVDGDGSRSNCIVLGCDAVTTEILGNNQLVIGSTTQPITKSTTAGGSSPSPSTFTGEYLPVFLNGGIYYLALH